MRVIVGASFFSTAAWYSMSGAATVFWSAAGDALHRKCIG